MKEEEEKNILLYDEHCVGAPYIPPKTAKFHNYTVWNTLNISFCLKRENTEGQMKYIHIIAGNLE